MGATSGHSCVHSAGVMYTAVYFEFGHLTRRLCETTNDLLIFQFYEMFITILPFTFVHYVSVTSGFKEIAKNHQGAIKIENFAHLKCSFRETIL